jgi:GNAT superfamily N-acetyltransferase
MQNIHVFEVLDRQFKDVSDLVKELLIELAPHTAEDLEQMKLDEIAKTLLSSSKIFAFLAKHNDENIGVITLHECAAIYAGGIFGEISELYVKPEYRSLKVGERLLESAFEKGRALGWKRIEVGSPASNKSPRTIQFYEGKGFKNTGSRLQCLLE